MSVDSIGQWLAGASAIGTGAFGMVETLKRTSFGVVGAGHVVDAIGSAGRSAFRNLYGADYEAVIKQAYRGDPKKLADQLKNALRVALRDKTIAADVANHLGQAAMTPDLGEAVQALEAHNSGSTPLAPADLAKNMTRVSAYTMAVDARVDAALASAASHYEAGMRIAAMVFAIVLSVAAWAATFAAHVPVWYSLDVAPPNHSIWEALILGLLAVPIAPIAKDATSLLQTASDVLTRRTRSRDVNT